MLNEKALFPVVPNLQSHSTLVGQKKCGDRMIVQEDDKM